MIEAAHARDIKVFAWFEFGFASSYGQKDGGHILRTKPEWISLDTNGEITSKNNFQWMNGYHPEVQQWLTDMVTEVVQNYDIDGIQGDDRLPAMPVNSGYDEYTKAQYRAEHSDNDPPANEKDFDWVEWRAKRMTLFLQNLYRKGKSHRQHVHCFYGAKHLPMEQGKLFARLAYMVASGLCGCCLSSGVSL